MVRETRYLWIGNLPEKASEERITEHFKRYGKIQSVKLHPKKEGDSDLSATVAFMDIRSASKAHNSKNELDDKTLCTNFAEPTASGSIVTRTCEVTSQLQREAPAASSAPAARSATTTNTAAPERGRFEPAHAGRGTPTAKRDGLADDRTEHGNRSERSTHSEDRLEHPDDYYLTRERGRERERFPRERNFSQRTPDGQTSTQRTDDADAKRFHRRKLNQASSAATRQSSLESQGSAKANNKKNAANSRQFRSRKSRSRSAGSTSSSMSSGSSSSSRSRSPSSSKARRSQLASKIEGVVLSSASVKDETTSESGGERKNLGICITRLPLRSTDTSLRDGLFHAYKKHGKVTSVVIQGETESRFAVVSFKKSEDAKKAQEASNEMTFFGSKISVTSHPGYEVEDSEFRPPEAELDEFHPKATRTLFVGNLEKDISPTQLKEIFKEFGEIIDIDIKKQGAVTAYAFVQYSDISSVVKALKKMDGESIGPNKIKLGFGKSMPTTCVWIDGVADTVTEKFLCRQFGRYGPVSHAVLDKHIGRALIYFDTLDFAQHSVSEMRGRALAGKKIQIDFASRDCQTSFFDKMQRSGQLRPGERPDERAIRTNPKFPVTPTYEEPRDPRAFPAMRQDMFEGRGRGSTFTSGGSRSRGGGTNSRNFRGRGGGSRGSFSEDFPGSGFHDDFRDRRRHFDEVGSQRSFTDDYESELRDYGYSQRDRHGSLSPPPRDRDRHFERRSLSPYGHGYPPSEGSMHGSARFDDRYDEHNADRFSRDTECQSDSRDSRRDHKDRPTEEKFRPHEKRSRDRDERRVRSRDSIPGQSPQSSEYSSHASPAGNRSRSLSPRDKSRDKDRSSRPATPPTPTRDELPQNSRGGQESPMDYETSQWNYGKYPDLRSHIKREGHDPTDLGNRKYDIDRGSAKSEQLSQKSHRTKHSDVDMRTRHGKYDSMDSMDVEKSLKSEVVVHKTGDRPSDVESQRKLQRQYSRSSTGSHGSRSKNVSDAHGDNCDTDKTSKGERTKALLCDERIVKHTKDYDKQRQASLHKDKNSKSKDDSGSSSDSSSESSNDNSDAEEGKEEVAKGASSDLNKLQSKKQQLLQLIKQLDETGSASDGDSQQDEEGKRLTKKPRLEDVFDLERGPKLSYRKVILETARALEEENKDVQQHSQQQLQMSQQQIIQLSETQHPKETKPLDPFKFKPIDSTQSFRKQMEARRKEMEKKTLGRMSHHQVRRGHGDNSQSKSLDEDLFDMGPENSPKDIPSEFLSRKRRLKTTGDLTEQESLQAKRSYRLKRTEDIFSSSGDEGDSKQSSTSKSPLRKNLDSNMDMLSRKSKTPLISLEGDTVHVDVRRKMEELRQRRVTEKRQSTASADIHAWSIQEARLEYLKRDFPLSLPLPSFALQSQHSLSPKASPKSISSPKIQSPQISPGIAKLQSPPFSPGIKAIQMFQPSTNLTKTDDSLSNATPTDDKIVSSSTTNAESLAGPVAPPMDQPLVLPGTTQAEQSDTVSVPSGTDSLTATSTTALKEKDGDIETENTEIVDASSVNVNDVAAETITKTSPARDSDNSDLSDLETPNSPNRPSLEERIRALDEKLSMASSLQSSVSLSTSTRTLDSSTPPTVTPIVDYNKYRIRKRGDSLSAVPMVPVTADKVEPSDIVKTLLSRSSIFDQDSRRLEQIHEKYEPKDNIAKSMVGESIAVVGNMVEPTDVMLQQKPGFRTKGAAKELPNLTQAAAQPLPGTRVPSLASSSPVTPMSTSSVSTPSTPLTPSTPATPGGACKPQTSAGMTAPGWKPVTDYAALKAAAQQQQQQLQIQTPPTVPQVMSTSQQQQPVPLKPILKKDISPSDPRKERSALYALKTDTAVMSAAPVGAAASPALPRKDSTSAFNSGGDTSHSGRTVSGGTSAETSAHAATATSKVKEESVPSSNRTPAPLGVAKETAATETPGELSAAPMKKEVPSRPDPRLNSGILGKRKANDDSAKMKEENKIREKKPKDVSNSAGGLQDSKNSASVNVVKPSEPETKKPKLQTKDSTNSSSNREKDRKEGGKEKKSNSVPSKNDNKDSTGDSSQTKEVVKKTQSSSSASSTSKSQKSVEKKPTKEGSAERGDKKSFPEPTKKVSNRESEKKASDKDAKFQDRSKERDKMKDRKDKSHSKDRHSREKEKSSEKSVSEKTSDKISSEKSEKPIVEKSNDKGNSEKSSDKSSSEKSLDKFGSEKNSKADKTSSSSQDKERVSDTKMRDKEKEKAGIKREAEKKRDKDVSSRDKDRQKAKDNDKARDGSKEREKPSSRNDDRSKHEPSPPKGKDEKDKQSVKSRDTKNEKTKKEADKDTSKSKQKVEKNETNKKAADDVETSKVKMEEKSGRPANKNTDQKKFKDSGDKGSQSSSPHASKTSKSTKEKDAAKKEPTKAEKPTKVDQTKSNPKSTPAKRGNDRQQSKSDVKKSKPSQDKAEEKRTQEREKEKEKSQKKKPEQHRLDPVLFDLTREQRDLLSNSEVFGDGLFEPYVSMYDKVKRRSSMIQENKRQPKSRDAGNKASRRRRKSGESDSSEDDETGTDSESQEDSEDNWGRGSPRKTVKRSQRKTGETKTNRMKKPILDSSSDEDSDKEEENSKKSADSSSDLESETVLSRVSKKSTSSKEKGKQDPAPKSNKAKKKPVPKKKTEKGKSVGFTTDSDSDVSIKATVKSTTLRKQKQSIWTSDEDTDSNADEEKHSPKVKPLHETSESEDTEIDLPKVSKGKKAVAKSTKKQAKPMAISTEDSSGIDEFSLPSTKSSKEKLKVGDYFSSESEETDDGAASKKHAKKSKAGKMDETKANIFKKIASNKDTPSKSEEQPQSEDESMKSPKKTPKKTKALKKMIGKKEPIKETTKEIPLEVKTEVKSEEDSDEEINKKKATKTPTKGGKMFEKKMDEKKANIFKKIAANKEAAKKVKAKRESTTESEETRGEDKLTDQNESSKDSDTKLPMPQQIKAEKPSADSGLPTTHLNKESKSCKGEREEGKEAFIATVDASKKTVKGKKEAQQGSKVGKVESKHPRLSETQPTVQKSAQSGEPSNANLLENVVQGSKPDAKPGDETVAKKDEERKKKKKKQKASILKDDMTENEHEQAKATEDNEHDVSVTVEQGLKDQSAKQDHGDFKIKVEKESSPVVEKQSDDDRLENVPIESVAETVEIQTECGQDMELPKLHETSKEEKGEEADSVNTADLEVPIGSPKKAQRVASKNKAKKGTVGKDGEKSDTEPKLSDASKRNKAPPKENAQRNIKSDPDDPMVEVSSKSQSEPVQKSSLDLIFDEITRESATMSADESSHLEAASTPGKAKPRRKAARQSNLAASGDDSQQGKGQTQEAPPEQSANETSTAEAATDDSDSPRSKRGRRTKPKVYSQDFITTLPRVSRTPSPKAASPRATRQGSAASPKAALTPSKTQPPPKAAGATPVKSEKLVRGKKEKEAEKSGDTDKETTTETKSMSVFDWQDSPDSSPIPPMRVQKTSVSESSSEVTPGGEQADKAKKSRGVRSGVKKKSDTQNSETDGGREKDEPILDPVTGLFRDKEGRVCPGYGVTEEEEKSQEADENSLNSNELELSQPTAESIAEDACAVSALLAMSDDIVPTPSGASETPSSNQATAIEDVSQPAPSQGLVKVPEPAQTKLPAVSTENPTPVAAVTSAAPIVLSNIDKVIDQVSKGEFEDSDYDVNSELYQSRMNSRRRSSDVRHLSGDGPRTPQTPQHVPAHLRSPPHIPHPLTSPQALHMDTHTKPSEKEVDTVRSSVEAGEPYVQSPTGLMMSPTYHYSHEKMPTLPIKTDVHMGVVQGAPHAMGQVERSPTGQVIERVPNPSISVATSQAPGPGPKHPTSKGMPEYQKGLPSQGYWDHTTMGMPQFMQGRPPVSSEGKPQGEGFPGYPAGIHPQRPPVGEPQSSSSHLSPSARGPQQHPPTWPPATQGHLHNQSLDARIPTPAQRAGTKEVPPVSQPADIRPLTPSQRARQEARGVVDAQHQAQYRRSPERPPQQKPPHQEFRVPVTSAAHAESVPSHHQPQTSTNATPSAPPPITGGQFSPRASTPGSSQHPPPPARGQPMHHLAEQQRRGTPGHGQQTPEVQATQAPQGQDVRVPMSETMQMRQQPSSPRAPGHSGVAQETGMYRQPVSVAQALSHHYPPGMYPPGMLHATPGGSAPPAQSPHSLQQASELRAVLNRPSLIAQHQAQLQQQLYVRPPLHHQVESTQSPGGVKNLSPVVGQGAVGTHTTKEGRVAPPPNNQPIESRVRMSQPGGPYGEMRVTQEDGRIVTLPSAFATPNGGRLGLVDARAELKQRTAAHPSVAHPDPRAPMAAHLPSEFLMQHGGMMPYPHTSLAGHIGVPPHLDPRIVMAGGQHHPELIARQGPPMIPTVVAQHHLAALQEAQSRTPDSQPISRPPSQFELPNQHSSSPVYSSAQAAVPPHMAHIPNMAERAGGLEIPQHPDNLLSLLNKYPVMWQGMLGLKNDSANVQMHWVAGNDKLVGVSLPHMAADGLPCILRIAQRMRLEPSQLDGVARRMEKHEDYCMMLALPMGRDHADVISQTHGLKTGFIQYLQQKQAAGIVNVPAPGSTQPAYVVHIFPPCEFSQGNLARMSPDLLQNIRDMAHLLIVIATV